MKSPTEKSAGPVLTRCETPALRARPLGCGLRARFDPDAPLHVVERFVLNHAIDAGVKRVVAAHPDVAARMHLGAALTYEDVSGFDGLASINFDAATLPWAVAAVAR